MNSKAPRAVSERLSGEKLSRLPEPVARHLEVTGAVGMPLIKTARLKQSGIYQLSQHKKKKLNWITFKAREYFNTEQASFFWLANMSKVPVIPLKVLNQLHQGNGRVKASTMGFWKKFDYAGPEIDQAEALRYLSELMLLPTQLADDRIAWKVLSENQVQATIQPGRQPVSGVFHFDAQGHLSEFSAQRYYLSGKQFDLQDWHVMVKNYKQFNGLGLPFSFEGSWKLKTRDFPYFRGKIEQIEFNNPETY